MLRFEDHSKDSPLRLLRAYALCYGELSTDFAILAKDRHLPPYDVSEMPVVENWSIRSVDVPALFGMVSYPGQELPLHQINGIPSFTAEVHLLSRRNDLVRCSNRWYRLGQQSADLGDLNNWLD